MTLPEKIEAYLRENGVLCVGTCKPKNVVARELAALMEGELRETFRSGAQWVVDNEVFFEAGEIEAEALCRYPDTPKGEELKYRCTTCGEEYAERGCGWHYKKNGHMCGKIVEIASTAAKEGSDE